MNISDLERAWQKLKKYDEEVDQDDILLFLKEVVKSLQKLEELEHQQYKLQNQIDNLEHEITSVRRGR